MQLDKELFCRNLLQHFQVFPVKLEILHSEGPFCERDTKATKDTNSHNKCKKITCKNFVLALQEKVIAMKLHNNTTNSQKA